MEIKVKHKTLLHQLSLTFLVFLFSQVVLGIILYFEGMSYFDPIAWTRWDSAHYLDIAKKGYEYFPCAGKFGYPLDAKEMCGNTGWFPGYSLLLRFLSLFCSDLILLGGIVSKCFYFLILFFVARVAEINKISFRSFIFLSCAALNFGFIYYNAIFPISALAFCIIASFYYYKKRNFIIASIFCFLASAFYTTGFLLTIVFSIYILVAERESFIEKIKKVMILGLAGLLGFVAVFLLIKQSVGNWNAFMTVQAKYGNGSFHNPFVSMINYVEKGFDSFSVENFKYYQTLVVIIMYLGSTLFFFFKKLYKSDLNLWAYICLTVFFFFPWLVGGDASFYRSEALLLPYLFLFRTSKTPVLLIVLTVLFAIGIAVSKLFFVGTLV